MTPRFMKTTLFSDGRHFRTNPSCPVFWGMAPAGRPIDSFKGVDSKARQIGFRMETSQEFGKAERAERAERADLWGFYKKPA